MMRFIPRPMTVRTGAKIAAMGALVGLTILVSWLLMRPKEAGPPVQANDQVRPAAFKYTGAGSCSSTNCHGGISPSPRTRITQDEFSTWVVKDKHAKAYNVLFNDQSKRMAQNLKLDKPEASAKCLDCHTTHVPAELRGQAFDMSDGVSCESCHGPAEKWLSAHTIKGWTHEQSVKAGMYDTKNTVKRAELCLSCHLGTSEKWVDHEMIAAGHPDLIFELDTFTYNMPPHWKEKDKGPWYGPRALAVGQAVALREGMRRLSWRVEQDPWERAWPELSEFDCYACHHSLREPSWRQVRGYQGTPGYPRWNDARYVVLRHIASLVSPEMRQTLDAKLDALHKSLGQPVGRRQQIATLAAEIASLANQLVRQVDSLKFDERLTRNLLRAVSGDAQVGFVSGIRAAEQVAMALDTLFATYSQVVNVPNREEIRAAISRLFDDLQDPARFDPARFATHMQTVHRFFQ